MKKRLTRGEKWLFASPVLFLAIAAGIWARQKSAPFSIDLPKSIEVEHLEFSPDSKRLLVTVQDRRTWTWISSSRVYDLETRSQVCDLETPTRLAAILRNNGGRGSYYQWLSWSRDGNSIVGGYLNEFAIWDGKSGQVKVNAPYTMSNKGWMRGELRFSPDGKTLISRGFPPAVYDVTTGEQLNKQATAKKTEGLAKSNDKLGLVATYNPAMKSFRVVDSKNQRVLWQTKINKDFFFEWSGDILWGCDFSSSAIDETNPKPTPNRLWLWNGKNRELLPSPPVPLGAWIFDFCFKPDNQTLTYATAERIPETSVTGKYKVQLVAWNSLTSRVLWRTRLAELGSRLEWSPDGKWLSIDCFLSQYQSFQRQLLVFNQNGKLRFERQPVRSRRKWSPDSKQLAIVQLETDHKQTITSSHIEIRRFED